MNPQAILRKVLKESEEGLLLAAEAVVNRLGEGGEAGAEEEKQKRRRQIQQAISVAQDTESLEVFYAYLFYQASRSPVWRALAKPTYETLQNQLHSAKEIAEHEGLWNQLADPKMRERWGLPTQAGFQMELVRRFCGYLHWAYSIWLDRDLRQIYLRPAAGGEEETSDV
nr:hypothetical protein [Anaerolineae bacterium]